MSDFIHLGDYCGIANYSENRDWVVIRHNTMFGFYIVVAKNLSHGEIVNYGRYFNPCDLKISNHGSVLFWDNKTPSDKIEPNVIYGFGGDESWSFRKKSHSPLFDLTINEAGDLLAIAMAGDFEFIDAYNIMIYKKENDEFGIFQVVPINKPCRLKFDEKDKLLVSDK